MAELETEISKKEQKVLKVQNNGQCIGCYSCMLACATTIHKSFSLTKSAISVRTSGGYQGRMVVNICRGCIEAPCVKACPFEALLQRSGGGVKFDAKKCTGCKRCLSGCPIGAIGFDEEEKRAIVCIQCGACVKLCPHRVIGMEVREYG